MMPTSCDSRKMLVLCPYPVGVAAGQRLKFEQYYADWTLDGWSIDVAPFMDDRLWQVAHERGHIAQKVAGTLRGCARRILDMTRVHRYDLVYCFMYVTPIGTSMFEQLTRRFA